MNVLETKIRMLKETKPRIRDDRWSGFICLNVEDTAKNEVEDELANEIKTFVRNALGLKHVDGDTYPCITLNEWIREHYPKIYDTMSHDDFTAARLQWVDWMIGKLKKGYDLK